MMMPSLRAATIGLLLAGAAPLFAQTAAPAASAVPVMQTDSTARRAEMHSQMRMQHAGHGSAMRGGMFAGMSDAGKATMRDAMKAGGDPRSDHDAVKAARDRMLALLDADTLDTAALKRAMDDERKAAQIGHDKRQAAMLAGFTKLSVADRKAFVANARAMKARMEARVGKMREQGRRGGPGGARVDDMPPPPAVL